MAMHNILSNEAIYGHVSNSSDQCAKHLVEQICPQTKSVLSVTPVADGRAAAINKAKMIRDKEKFKPGLHGHRPLRRVEVWELDSDNKKLGAQPIYITTG